MSPTWFVIKSLFVTFGIVSLLQIRIGADSKTLELYFTDWMKSLSASQRIQDVAQGGKELTTDIIKEFTTPDGSKIYIHEKANSKSNEETQRSKASLQSSKNKSIYYADTIKPETNVIQRLISGLKLDFTDLNDTDKFSVKEQVRKEIEKEVRKDYEARLKKSGIDPKTLDSVN